MSWQAVEWAMDRSPMLLTDKGKPDTTARHVLAVLAEFAEDDGSDARPALLKLQYRSGYDRRTVQRALRRLEVAGLIKPEGTKYGCTIYRLTINVIRPESDWEELEVEEEQRQEADAERQRRHRAKRVTHSDDVTVTDAECVTEPDVTHSDDVSHALNAPTSRTQNPDVTDATPPDPSFDPPGILPLSSVVDQLGLQSPAQAERETEAAPDNSNDGTDVAKVVEAWTTARGKGRNPAAETKVRNSALLLLSVGWTIPDLIGLAEDMARRQPAYMDLGKHEPHWARPKQTAPGPRPRAVVDHTEARRLECEECGRPVNVDAPLGLCPGCHGELEQAISQSAS